MSDIKSAFAAIDARLVLIALVSGAAWTIGNHIAEKALKKTGDVAKQTVNSIVNADD